MRDCAATGPRPVPTRHDRAESPGSVDRPAVQAAVDRAFTLLLQAEGRDRAELRPDAADRRASFGTGDPVLRCPPNDLAPAQ